jgi:hypothetical protein
MQDITVKPSGLRPWQHIAVFLFACAIIVARRPDGLFHAQFFAEDGKVWFADAYNLGWWPALARPWAGHFQTLPRLGAALALLVPLFMARRLLNFIAIFFQALPVNLLLASRSSAWGSLRVRVQFAAVYLLLPNSSEVSYGITPSQWQLALCTFLVLVACMPNSIAGRYLDISIVILCGLTGPFCIFLLPIAIFLAWIRRDRWRWVPVGVFAACCLVQAWGLLVANRSVRPDYILGASVSSLARILAGQVYLGTLIGSNALAYHPGTRLSIFLFAVAICGTTIVIVSFIQSSLEMRLFLLFSFVLLAASLVSPVVRARPGVPVWELMAGAGGIHYWFFPTLAFGWCVLCCFNSRVLLLKVIAGYLLFFLSIGIFRDFRQPAFQDLHFNDYAARFEQAPPGTAVTIPENPDGWSMILVKHP